MQKILLYVILPLLLAAVVFLFVIPQFERDRYDFTLDGANGKVRLSDYRGKVAVVYFGYSFCPDICPTSLTTVASGIKMLDPDDAEQVQLIFISVDPERDSPESLHDYVRYFYPTFVGVTGSREAIDDVTARYDGTAYTITDANDSAMGYSVGHTSYVYFFDSRGNLSSRLEHSNDPSRVLTHLKKALAE